MRITVRHILPVFFILFGACENEDGIMGTRELDDDIVTFQHSLTNFRMNSAGDISWDVRINNTSDVTISYWHLTMEVQTDIGRTVTGSLFDEDLSLYPDITYVAQNLSLSVRPSCVNLKNAWAILVPTNETIVRWTIIGVYAEGG